MSGKKSFISFELSKTLCIKKLLTLTKYRELYLEIKKVFLRWKKVFFFTTKVTRTGMLGRISICLVAICLT